MNINPIVWQKLGLAWDAFYAYAQFSYVVLLWLFGYVVFTASPLRRSLTSRGKFWFMLVIAFLFAAGSVYAREKARQKFGLYYLSMQMGIHYLVVLAGYHLGVKWALERLGDLFRFLAQFIPRFGGPPAGGPPR